MCLINKNNNDTIENNKKKKKNMEIKMLHGASVATERTEFLFGYEFKNRRVWMEMMTMNENQSQITSTCLQKMKKTKKGIFVLLRKRRKYIFVHGKGWKIKCFERCEEYFIFWNFKVMR